MMIDSGSGAWVGVRAEVATVDGLSAHADRDELIGWAERMGHPPKRIFLVHGEPAAADALRVRIADRLGTACTVPQHADRATLA